MFLDRFEWMILLMQFLLFPNSILLRNFSFIILKSHNKPSAGASYALN